jgi:GTP-binding protein
VSAAKPKIADYPFTTLEPHLGVVRLDDGFEFVVADIPGLIEGASEGRGLGHRFLRHIERARVLLVLLDLAMVDGTSPEDQLRVLLHELETYRPDLVARPRLVIGSRADIASDLGAFDGLRVSAVTGENLPQVTGRLGDLVRAVRVAIPPREGVVVRRPEGESVAVLREGESSFVVRGRAAERAVRVSDLTNPEALEYVRHRLKSLGVERELVRAGARSGDVVRVGDFEFEYKEDL